MPPIVPRTVEPRSARRRRTRSASLEGTTDEEEGAIATVRMGVCACGHHFDGLGLAPNFARGYGVKELFLGKQYIAIYADRETLNKVQHDSAGHCQALFKCSRSDSSTRLSPFLLPIGVTIRSFGLDSNIIRSRSPRFIKVIFSSIESRAVNPFPSVSESHDGELPRLPLPMFQLLKRIRFSCLSPDKRTQVPNALRSRKPQISLGCRTALRDLAFTWKAVEMSAVALK